MHLDKLKLYKYFNAIEDHQFKWFLNSAVTQTIA